MDGAVVGSVEDVAGRGWDRSEPLYWVFESYQTTRCGGVVFLILQGAPVIMIASALRLRILRTLAVDAISIETFTTIIPVRNDTLEL
jgi:hypothetical protein